MITKLDLHNFRTHVNTELNFSPSVNIIVGPSDAGKSNIMRAYQWVVHNRPLGKKIIQRGKDEAGVQVFTEIKGRQISVLRAKGKNLNVYSLDVDGQEAKFTTDFPPEAVKEALNLSDINIQKQKEWYFLAFDSPGHVATYIRSITKLDEIDTVRKLLASKIGVQNGDISDCQTELDGVGKELEVLSKIDLDGLEKAVKKTHSLLRSNEKLTREYEELEVLLSRLKEIEENLIFLPEDIDQVLEKSDQLGESFQKISDEKEDLQSLVIELKEIEENLVFLPKDIDQVLEKSDRFRESFQKTSNEKESLQSLITELKEMDSQIIILPSDLSILSSSKIIEQGYNNIYKNVKELNILVDDLKEVEREIENSAKGIIEQMKVEKDLLSCIVECPECGQELTEKAKKNLLEKSNC